MHIKTLKHGLTNPDIRTKILYVLGILAIYRLGSTIPTPGIDYTAVQKCVETVPGNNLYALINLFSGGALLQLSVFAPGIMPYITASIIIQLLAVVIPKLENLKKEGQQGQNQITQYTRYLTVALAALQAASIIALAKTPGQLFQGCSENIIPQTQPQTLAVMILTMTAGTILVMWLAELITAKGIGNGMSLLIFTSIIATIPAQFTAVYQANGTFALTAALTVGILIIAFVVFMEQAQRRIPITYARKTTSTYAAPKTYLPLKVNMAGVIPVIFASSIMYMPIIILQITQNDSDISRWLLQNFQTGNSPLYIGVFITLIIFFTYFYISITFNPNEQAENINKSGGNIPGIRPGKETENYLTYILNRLTLPGSIYLALIAAMPIIAFGGLGVGANFVLGGTSLLIMVGVGLDTLKQIDSQLTTHNYEGFLK